MINPKTFLLILYFSFLVFFSKAQTPFAVVELFTSEGCSSCPPAEKLLSDLKSEAAKNNRRLFCLEYHVDYWNRLGWKDPYSSFQYTLRQKNYTSVLNEESVYTPMMVVNGSKSFLGSDAQKARSAIAAAFSTPQDLQLSIHIDSVSSDTLFVQVRTSKSDKNFFIRASVTENKLVSKVSKGENSGKTLMHDNVVRVFFAGEMKVKTGQLKIPLKKFLPDKNCELTVFVQHKQSMHILAAASKGFAN